MQNELQQAKEALHSITTSEKSVSSKITTALHHLENLTKHAREFDDNEAQTENTDTQNAQAVDTTTAQQVNPQSPTDPHENPPATDPSTDTTVPTA